MIYLKKRVNHYIFKNWSVDFEMVKLEDRVSRSLLKCKSPLCLKQLLQKL